MSKLEQVFRNFAFEHISSGFTLAQSQEKILEMCPVLCLDGYPAIFNQTLQEIAAQQVAGYNIIKS